MQSAAGSNPFAWVASNPWLYPALSAVHVIGIAMLLGSLALLELRVLGLGAPLPVQALARLALPLTLAGFGLAAITGLGMFAGQPTEMLANRVFLVKMGLVLAAGLNAAAFHARGGLTRLDRTARAQTVLSLGLWMAVIFCGRWIAFY